MTTRDNLATLPWLLLATIVAESVLLTNAQTCPEKCQCDIVNGIYDCRSAGLTDFPDNLPSPNAVKELLLSNNVISRIDQLSVMLYKNLRKLDVAKCRLTEIDETTFENLKNITELRFGDNIVSHIGTKTFHGLGELKYLDLSGNGLDRISSSVFQDLRLLKTLDLSRNEIEKIDKNAFIGLISLETLDLSVNQLHGVPVESLSAMPSLRSLSLGSNVIDSIQSHSFRTLRNLQKLQLHNNHITLLSDLAFHGKDSIELPKLKYLTLRGNTLPKVPITALQNLSALETLDLSDNPISSINQNSFIGLERLVQINLNEMNELTTVEPYSFSTLKYLEGIEMHRNIRLRHLPPFAFAKLPSLKNLDLCCNSLTDLDENLLELWDQLDQIDLRLNPWHCDCNLAWLGQFLQNHTDKRMRSNVKCHTPRELSNKPIIHVQKFDCDSVSAASRINKSSHSSTVMWGLIGCTLTVIVLILIGIVVYKHRHLFDKYLHNQMRYRAQHDTGMDSVSSRLSVA